MITETQRENNALIRKKFDFDCTLEEHEKQSGFEVWYDKKTDKVKGYRVISYTHDDTDIAIKFVRMFMDLGYTLDGTNYFLHFHSYSKIIVSVAHKEKIVFVSTIGKTNHTLSIPDYFKDYIPEKENYLYD